MNIYIVTDGGVALPQHLLYHPQLTIVPDTLRSGTFTLQQGADVDTALISRVQSGHADLESEPGSVQTYIQTYAHLSSSADAIISIHSSTHLSDALKQAQLAVQHFAGSFPIEIINSKTTDLALGLLVEMALSLVQAGESFEEIVNKLRHATDRVYSLYHTSNSFALNKNEICSTSHHVLAQMHQLGLIISVEQGQLVLVEKAQTSQNAVERLAEFILEFEQADIDACVIGQSFVTDANMVQKLAEQIGDDLEFNRFHVLNYSLTLSTYLGFDAFGIAILEAEHEQWESEYEN
ncbi:DegV family protein [Anaerolineales bacterium]